MLQCDLQKIFSNIFKHILCFFLSDVSFISAFTDDAPGSMGMYDQVLAIQWIKDNAKYFGGDPDKIVLFGESAGSFSVSLHMISPLSKNLFNRGILQSGSVFSPLYSESNGPLSATSAMVANIVGCAADEEALTTNPAGVVDCMRNIPQEKIVEADLAFLKNKGILIPRVGDDFLPTTPTDLFRTGKSKHAEMLIGVTRDEGSMLLTFMRSDIFGAVGEKVDSNSFNDAEAQQLVTSLLHFETSKDFTQSYFEKVKEGSRYTYLNALSDLVGDFMLTCGAVFQADYHSLQNQPAYFYIFDYRPPSSPFAEWMGVFHTAELPYVFGNPIGKTFTDFEDEFSKDIMDMWTTFAKTGYVFFI